MCFLCVVVFAPLSGFLAASPGCLVEYSLWLSWQNLKKTIFLKNFFIHLFNFWLHWAFAAARRFSLVAESGGYSLLRCTDFSLRWLLLLQSMGSRRAGFNSCGTQVSVVVACGL